MIRRFSEMEGYRVRAGDGEVGSLDDLFFDDAEWTVRYLVVNVGSMLAGRRVLLSPDSVETVNGRRDRIEVSLTREQIETSPGTDTHRPISRRHQIEVHEHFGWPLYWERPGASADAHLRSAREVKGYNLHAEDGELGQADDFLVEEVGWPFRYLVVDTGTWLPGRKVLLAIGWILSVSWRQQEIFVRLTREQVKSSPEYHSAREMTSREYGERLHRHYGLPLPSHFYTGEYTGEYKGEYTGENRDESGG